MESCLPNAFKGPRKLDESEGITTRESTLLNMCDGVRYCDPLQGFAIIESIVLDGSNGRMKDDFRDIFRGAFTIETMISVDGRCEVWNDFRWHVSTQFELMTRPINIISISPRDCEGPSVHRDTAFARGANDPWINFHVGMWKLHILTTFIYPMNV